MANYLYKVKISERSELFNSEPFSKIFTNFKEAIITSERFDSFEQSETALIKLLYKLGNATSAITKKGYVVVHKRNPGLGVSVDGDEDWPIDTEMKLYLAESGLLKDSILSYAIFAQIIADIPEHIGSDIIN